MVVMFHARFLSVWLRLALITVALGLAEVFGGKSDDGYEEEELRRLRELAEGAAESFGWQMPASATGGFPVLDFDRVRSELDLLGFDCTEIHRGIDQDLFESGVRNVWSGDPPTEVIVARVERRS
jgi:hypothetical protein